MKPLHLSIVVIFSVIALGISTVHSSYSTEFNATMDKMYYNNTDTAHVIISGPPSTPINLAVIDSSSQQKLATVVHLDPNGAGIFSFNLTSFTDGIYYVMVGQGYDRVKIGFGVGLFPAGPTIVLSTPKFNFVDGEIIPISGHTLRNSLVNIFLVDNYGNIENSTRVTSDYTGSFYANLGIPSHVIGGGWYLFAKSDEGSWTSEIMVNTHGVSTMTLHIPSGLSPLKQFKLGIPIESVQCNQGFQLILKREDASPACVKPDTARKLIERDWGFIRGVQTFFPFGNITNSTSLGNATLPASFMPCDTPYPQNGTGVAVLYMPVNSTGKICVRYSNFNDFPAPLGIRIFNANNGKDATEISTWDDIENNTIPKGNSTVVYWIKTGNHAGFYGLTIFCVGMPFAVGYDNNSTIVSNDFPWLGGTYNCPMMTYQYHIDSLTGIGVKYIPYP